MLTPLPVLGKWGYVHITYLVSHLALLCDQVPGQEEEESGTGNRERLRAHLATELWSWALIWEATDERQHLCHFSVCRETERKRKAQRKENRERKGRRVQSGLETMPWISEQVSSFQTAAVAAITEPPLPGNPAQAPVGAPILSPLCRSCYPHFLRCSSARWWWARRHWSHGTDMKDTGSWGSAGSCITQVQKTRL